MSKQATFLLFNDAMRCVCVSALGSDDYLPFFESQRNRINIWWNLGETIESAKEMMRDFASGYRKKQFQVAFSKTAKQLAISYVEA